MQKNTDEIQAAANWLKALGNIHRLQIIRLLLDGEKSVSALNEWVAITQPALSQSLTILRKNGIVKSRRESRNIFYQLVNDDAQNVLQIVAGRKGIK